MNQIIAEEYRTAARVLRQQDVFAIDSAYIDLLLAKVTKQEARDSYAVDLGWLDGGASPFVRGVALLGKLLKDGWTPPEGLF